MNNSVTGSIAGVVAMTMVACASSQTATPRSVESIASEYRTRGEELRTKAQREVVWIDCKTPSRPSDSECGLLSDQMLTTSYVEVFRAASCPENIQGDLSDECAGRFVAAFRSKLAARYPRSTENALREQCARYALECVRLQEVELATMAAHNAATWEKLRGDTDTLMMEFSSALEARRSQVEAAEQQRARDQAVWRAMAAGFAGAAAGMQQGLAARSQPAPEPGMSYTSPPTIAAHAPSVLAPSARRSCFSDVECGIGNACVKGQFNTQGFCAKTVNEYGVQTFGPPRANYGVGGPGQCRFNTDCPPAFHCRTDGDITGTCMK